MEGRTAAACSESEQDSPFAKVGGGDASGDSRKKDVLIIDGVRTMRRHTGEVSCIHRNQGII